METAIIIDAPSKIVWRILTDTACWKVWGPSVSSIRCKDRFIQSGTTGHVKVLGIIWLPFIITDFVPGKNWSWRVMNIHATGHRLESISNKQCRLTFEVPIIAFPYILICKIAIQRIKQIAESKSLKNY
jgi:hypothetical protein